MIAHVKPRYQWRNNDRGYLRLLQKAIIYMQKRDLRMSRWSAKKGVAGFYFADPARPELTDALQTLLDRIDECLVAKTT